MKFIKSFKHASFGINYDSGNSASLDEALKEFNAYGKYIRNIHIKDRLKMSKCKIRRRCEVY